MSINKATIEKLRKILEISDSIKIEQMRNMLNLDKKTFDENLLNWAVEFGFRIDREYINISNASIDDFIIKLEAQFDLWEKRETAAIGKLDDQKLKIVERADDLIGIQLEQKENIEIKKIRKIKKTLLVDEIKAQIPQYELEEEFERKEALRKPYLVKPREIDDKLYLDYLLQYLDVDELKFICNDYYLEGDSKNTKEELIEFILESLSEEDYRKVLDEWELKIILGGIDEAIDMINGGVNIEGMHAEEHEVEIKFDGQDSFYGNHTSYLSITPENIDDPNRQCTCEIGTHYGFCCHFWFLFIFLLKKGYFDISDWNLTRLPEDFKNYVQTRFSPDPEGFGRVVPIIFELRGKNFWMVYPE